MIVAAALLLAGAGASLALIARELGKAPEGYEDDHGFHTVHRIRAGRLKQKLAVEPTANFACKISSGIEMFAGQLIMKRRTMPSAPSAAPSNITVVPPSGS